jgi:sulfur carrier protein
VIRAVVNGAPCELAPGTTVGALVARLRPDSRGVAVAIDREVVPRSAWERTVVPEDAQVEIVEAVAGG